MGFLKLLQEPDSPPFEPPFPRLSRYYSSPIHAKQRRHAPAGVPNHAPSFKPASNHRKEFSFDHAVLEHPPGCAFGNVIPTTLLPGSHNFTSGSSVATATNHYSSDSTAINSRPVFAWRALGHFFCRSWTPNAQKMHTSPPPPRDWRPTPLPFRRTTR